ncbi:hypothetical protein CW751_06745 [Brumimicrobium salinarum]|uniref:Uncharacterized protein n=1 Tax=Brumimicrobium salinarum TaxID=2058658 RepID=A0A2I0R2Q1_9FLAO|nr:hypothetical protein [Brumimicrobium salinarum]PKR80863.1 hypothetical protein CW751_06745 [Brumimicrobium salinarum]
MEVLNFIFRIGVILAVYNFLWWIIMLFLNVLRGGKPKMLFEVYLIKSVRYLFLVDVIFLFAIKQASGMLILNDILLAGMILLIYFIGKIQSKQQRQSIFQVRGQANIPGVQSFLNGIKPAFDIRLEIAVVVLAVSVLFGFYFAPHLASNTISNWFLESILNIEDTPVFGFIFKVIGFFFMMSVIFKIIGSIMTLLSGGNRGNQYDDQDDDDNGDDDHFDDYTEVK